MNVEIINTAKAWIQHGYSVIPVNSNKTPSCFGWGKYQISPPTPEEVDNLFKDAWGMAVLCGGQGRLVAFDFDLKYSLNPYLWDEIKKAIPVTILNKAYVQSTKNGGYHMVFKAPATRLFGNQKFAMRRGTPEEKHVIYTDAYNNPDTRAKALKIAENYSLVLAESRSGSEKVAGGYILLPPSPGYAHVYGKLSEINEEEYDLIVEVLRSFNEVRKEERKSFCGDGGWETTPFDHYNADGDIIDLLTSHGWVVSRDTAGVTDFLRPGNTPTNKSAMFDKNTRVFTCFSTSTVFDPDKSLNLVGVLSTLEFNGSVEDTYEYLIKNGYGVRK
jgi:hypothetical protein